MEEPAIAQPACYLGVLSSEDDGDGAIFWLVRIPGFPPHKDVGGAGGTPAEAVADAAAAAAGYISMLKEDGGGPAPEPSPFGALLGEIEPGEVGVLVVLGA